MLSSSTQILHVMLYTYIFIYLLKKICVKVDFAAHAHVLHRARTNNFTICMEIQKTSNSQSDLEKEEWNWRNQPA